MKLTNLLLASLCSFSLAACASTNGKSPNTERAPSADGTYFEATPVTDNEKNAGQLMRGDVLVNLSYCRKGKMTVNPRTGKDECIIHMKNIYLLKNRGVSFGDGLNLDVQGSFVIIGFSKKGISQSEINQELSTLANIVSDYPDISITTGEHPYMSLKDVLFVR